MIEPDHPRLSIVRQCALVRIARSSHYYTGGGESALNLQLMRLIDEQYLCRPLGTGRDRWRVISSDRATRWVAKGSVD